MNNSNLRTTGKKFSNAEKQLIKALLWNTQQLYRAWDGIPDESGQESADADDKAHEQSYKMITGAFGVVNLYGITDEERAAAFDDGELSPDDAADFYEVSLLIAEALAETGAEIQQMCLTARQKLAGDQSAELIRFPSPPNMH